MPDVTGEEGWASKEYEVNRKCSPPPRPQLGRWWISSEDDLENACNCPAGKCYLQGKVSALRSRHRPPLLRICNADTGSIVFL